MARRFIRPRLSDQQGNVLSGGWLRVLAAGTDTEVDVFASAVGGTALEQPRSTDSRGEVECWLDDSADVDLEWSDSGATYRGGTSRRVAFSTFTEFVEAPPIGGGGGGSGLHADLTDLATSGHPASAISGLGGAAVLDVGTTVGTVAAGDDDRFLPPDPGAALSALANVSASSDVGNAVAITWGVSADPTMAGGLGRYRMQVAVDSGFGTVVSDKVYGSTNAQFVVNAIGVPPLWFRVRAEDAYGNVGPWVAATGNPVTVAKITPSGIFGLGDAAELDVGTSTGTVAAGDDARFVPAPADPADDGKVLTADSGGATWAFPTGGAAPVAGPTFSSGKYAGWSGSIDARTTNEDRGFYVPMPIPRDLTVDRIGVEVTSSATGSPVIRLGIYADNNGVPGALLVDAGTVDASSPGFKEATINQALTTGMVWLFCAQQGGTSNGAVRATRYATHVGIPSSGYTPYECGAWVDADASTGAMSNPASAMSDVASAAPRILLRVV